MFPTVINILLLHKIRDAQNDNVPTTIPFIFLIDKTDSFALAVVNRNRVQLC